MKTNREFIVRRFAGTVIIASLALALWVNIQWLWLTAFVGFNLLQSSFTKFCPLTIVLEKLNIGSTALAMESPKTSGKN